MFDEFNRDVLRRFRGRLMGIDKLYNPHNDMWRIGLVIYIPEHEVTDELEIYARINKVIEVIAEGE
jgi:hypothetical protein